MAEMRKLKSNLSKIEFENVLGELVQIVYNPGDLTFRENCGKLLNFVSTKTNELAKNENEAREKMDACESDEEKLALQMEINANTKKFCEYMETEIDSIFGNGISAKSFCGYKDPLTYADFVDMLGNCFERDSKAATQKYAKHPANKKK